MSLEKILEKIELEAGQEVERILSESREKAEQLEKEAEQKPANRRKSFCVRLRPKVAWRPAGL